MKMKEPMKMPVAKDIVAVFAIPAPVYENRAGHVPLLWGAWFAISRPFNVMHEACEQVHHAVIAHTLEGLRGNDGHLV